MWLRKFLRCIQGPESAYGATGASIAAPPPPGPKEQVPVVAHQIISQHFNQLSADGQRELLAEYDSLQELDMMETSEAAEHSANARKNRYVNVLPYDFNRVKISGETDYINASLLQSEAGEQPAWCYIAAQGPLASTIADFWKMVFENKVSHVIMLTRTVENNHVKCAEYFPSDIGEALKFKNYKVSTIEAQRISADIVQRQLQVKHQKTQETHTVLHYHYHLWPDHGVPVSTESIRTLSRLLHDSATRGGGGPQVVHCSAGIGRTGAFIAIDVIMKRLRGLADSGQPISEAAIKQAVEVPGVVHALRRMRRGMVQTLDQYEFIYKALLEELETWMAGGLTVSAGTPIPHSGASANPPGSQPGVGPNAVLPPPPAAANGSS